MPPIVSIENLFLGFGDVTLFDGLNCDVEPGSILAVVGANGSGKSTFVKTLLGLQSPMDGRIEWPVGKPAEIGYLAQLTDCLLYTSPSPRDLSTSRMPSSA